MPLENNCILLNTDCLTIHMPFKAEYVNLLNALLLNNYYDNPPYLTQNKLLGDYTQVAPKYKQGAGGVALSLKDVR